MLVARLYVRANDPSTLPFFACPCHLIAKCPCFFLFFAVLVPLWPSLWLPSNLSPPLHTTQSIHIFPCCSHSLTISFVCSSFLIKILLFPRFPSPSLTQLPFLGGCGLNSFSAQYFTRATPPSTLSVPVFGRNIKKRLQTFFFFLPSNTCSISHVDHIKRFIITLIGPAWLVRIIQEEEQEKKGTVETLHAFFG